jgi:predicted DNA-binding protein
MSQFTIDVDSEAVFLDGTWYTREDLSRRIRAMLDSGDFNVATPSLALQELTQTLQGVRTLAFRCTPELADALTQLGARMGQSVSSLVREAVTQFITDATSAPPQALQATADSTVRVQHPSGPVVDAVVEATQQEPGAADGGIIILAQTSSTQDDLQRVVVDEQPMVIAGPGALRAAGVLDAGAPVELTNVKRQGTPPDESTSSEHRWFKQ